MYHIDFLTWKICVHMYEGQLSNNGTILTVKLQRLEH